MFFGGLIEKLLDRFFLGFRLTRFNLIGFGVSGFVFNNMLF